MVESLGFSFHGWACRVLWLDVACMVLGLELLVCNYLIVCFWFFKGLLGHKV